VPVSAGTGTATALRGGIVESRAAQGITSFRAGDRVGSHRHHGRRYSTYSVAIGAGLVANVVNGTLTGFGLEPTTPVLVGRGGQVSHADRRRPALVWVAPIAGAAAAAGAVATSVVLRHRRAA
jgi:hypothetical protein